MFLATIRRTALCMSSLICVPSVFLPMQTLQAQAPAFRSVTGTVAGKDGAKLKGAVVHLKDTRSLSQRTFITADDGSFRFAQLSTSSDYEVWADLDGKRSASKTISSFDNKKAVEIALKMPD